MKLEKSDITGKLKTASKKLSFLRILFFLLAVILISSESTDADLSDQEIITNNLFTSTTLDFSPKNTANHHPLSSLFAVSDFIPDGFAVASVLLKNDGQQNSPIRLNSEPVLGNSDLYQALNLKVIQDWQIIYDDKLANLNLDLEAVDSGQQSLIFVLSFNQNNPSLKSQQCQFNFVFQTIINQPNSGGFSDIEILENHISSSIW